MNEAYQVACNIFDALSSDQRRNLKLYRKQAAKSWLFEHYADEISRVDADMVVDFLQAKAKEG